ncbi:type II methionyl aminopeptidase [Candidatus Woesearchaeota archaeon]|nr:type II methionyl aminopeptidase [Candidatus Woesearchaeota archaeon]
MDKEIKEKYLKAGRIAKKTLDMVKTKVKEGIKLADVTDFIEENIKKMGGGLAFPAQISVNNIAAHYAALFEDKTVFKKNDMVKIDIGVHIDGYIADTAITIIVGEKPDEKLERLSLASKEALDNALEIIKPGIEIREIGKIIQDTITKFGFSPVINLSGHGLERYQIHCKPSIPNFDNRTKEKLKEGQVIAIEPFATDGKGKIYESSNASVFSLIEEKPVRSRITREILREIKKYNRMPFSERRLMKKFGKGKTIIALKELMGRNLIQDYPPLPEINGGMISQWEHSVIIEKKPVVFTRDIN